MNENDVPKYLYAINGLGGGDAEGIGFIDNSWCGYYSERGSYRDIERYESEDIACRSFAQEIRVLMKDAFSKEIPPPV